MSDDCELSSLHCLECSKWNCFAFYDYCRVYFFLYIFREKNKKKLRHRLQCGRNITRWGMRDQASNRGMKKVRETVQTVLFPAFRDAFRFCRALSAEAAGGGKAEKANRGNPGRKCRGCTFGITEEAAADKRITRQMNCLNKRFAWKNNRNLNDKAASGGPNPESHGFPNASGRFFRFPLAGTDGNIRTAGRYRRGLGKANRSWTRYTACIIKDRTVPTNERKSIFSSGKPGGEVGGGKNRPKSETRAIRQTLIGPSDRLRSSLISR